MRRAFWIAAVLAFARLGLGDALAATRLVPPAPPECASQTATFSQVTPTPIPDEATVVSTVVVSGMAGVLWDLDVVTTIPHTFSADLDITLTSPEGTVVTLTTDSGGGNNDVFNGTLWDSDADPGSPVPYGGVNPNIVTDHVFTAADGVVTPLVPKEPLGVFALEDPNGTWTLTVSDDAEDDTGTLQSWSLVITTTPLPPVNALHNVSNENVLPIPDSGSGVATSTIALPDGFGSRVSEVTLNLSITHTFPSDLDITLTSPAGTVVTLTTDNGGTADGAYQGTAWDDTADRPVTEYGFPPGPTPPLSPEEALSAFDGEDPAGTWTLTISDDFPGDVGTLNSWSIILRAANCAVSVASAPQLVDEHPGAGSSNLNGVYEMGESARVEPSRANSSPTPYDLLTAFIQDFQGPAGLTYTIVDSAGLYGAIPAGAIAPCSNCFEVQITGPRPAGHLDAEFEEIVFPIALTEGIPASNAYTYSLHVGGSFADVPEANLFYRFIETLLHRGVTAGGACGGFCPTDTTLRKQMAVFIVKSQFGPVFLPPPAAGIFTDVPTADPFAPWIEFLYNAGIVAGCGPGPTYCPNSPVLRQQMAVFLLKAWLGSAHVPDPAVGLFADVPTDNPFAPWIEELYAQGITGGCATAPLRYCPAAAVNRGQMATFLTKTFGLRLYGP